MTDLTWREYITERGLAFPEGQTWADVPRQEYRRLTRNYLRWRRRRLERLRAPLCFRVTKTGRLVREGPNGERWRAW